MAHTKPQQKKAKSYEERDQIEFIDLRFERWQVLRSRKATKARRSINCVSVNDTNIRAIDW